MQVTAGWPAHIFMIGCGNMAGAMLSRWIDCGLNPARVTVFRPSGRSASSGVQVVNVLPDSLPGDVMVLLGMKPQQIQDVSRDWAGLLEPQMTLISILAGVTVESLRNHFPIVENIIRVMPNTPVAVGQGVCAVFADPSTSSAVCGMVTDMLRLLGLVEWMPDETAFNLAAALSGCGPAYLFRFIDGLAAAGQSLGLEEHQATRLALATVQGAATLAIQAAESPSVLADRVASAGGMTRKGMDILDRDAALKTLLADTLRAARDRGIEMSSVS